MHKATCTHACTHYFMKLCHPYFYSKHKYIGGLLKKRIVLAINRYIVSLYTNQVFMTYSKGCEAAPVAVCIEPLVLRTNPMFIQPCPILIIL